MGRIKDAGGNFYAQVDSKKRLRVYAVIEDEPTCINRNEAQMYSAMFTGAITADTASNWIVYFKNNNLNTQAFARHGKKSLTNR